MAEKKFRNFVEYKDIYPEYSFVFIGDNGQGDLRAGIKMIQECFDVVEAVFIHIVQPLELTRGWSDYEKLLPEQKAKIRFFHDYVEAATLAAGDGLISDGDLLEV